MNIARIKRKCLEARTIAVMHADEGDWIGDGDAWWTCDGLRFGEEQIVAVMGLTAKRRAMILFVETTPGDAGFDEADFTQVSDATDELLKRETTICFDGGSTIGVYRSRNAENPEAWIIREDSFTPVQGKEGTEIALRRCQDGSSLMIAVRGYLTVGVTRPFERDGEVAASIVRRLLQTAETITGGIRHEKTGAGLGA